MRDELSNILVNLGKAHSDVLLLTGDHGYALFDDFRRECAEQYINAGIAEQNMVGVAAGLARSGFRPIVYGLSAFVPIRVLEQIKLDVAHDNLGIIFIGDGAGFVYSHLGTSHQSTEDIACSRSVPNLSVYSPADKFELARCMEIAFEDRSTAYIRIGKADIGDIHQSMLTIEKGGLINIKKGSEFSFIATGSMVKSAMEVANKLDCNIGVWSAPFIKPINYKIVESICHNSRAIVVFEEHSKYGGLGSLISEISTTYDAVKILRIAVDDRFSDKCGTYEYLLKEHGLDFDTIYQKVSSFLLRI